MITAHTHCASVDAYACIEALVKRFRYDCLGKDAPPADLSPDAFIDFQTSNYTASKCATCKNVIMTAPKIVEDEYGTCDDDDKEGAWDCVINLKRAFCRECAP